MNRHALVAAVLLAASPALAAKSLSLHEAAFAGDLKAIERALEKTPVDALDDTGSTALKKAIDEKRFEAVKLLLEKGASLSAIDDAYRGPLQRAAAAGSVPVLELLLQRGADPKSRGLYGDLGLVSALRAGQEDAARRLLEASPEPLAETDAYGRTPLNAAVRLPSLFAELASKPGALDGRQNDGETLLMSAAAAGATDTVRWLLQNGADREAQDQYGQKAWYYAAAGGSMETFKLLVPAELPAEPCESGYCTPPLQRAAGSGSLEIVRWLLAKGADPAAGSGWDTPLHVAKPLPVLRALLDAGVPVDLPNNYDVTPLMRAARYGTLEAMRALLDAGASAAAEDYEGRTPLSYAAESGELAKVKLLLEKGADRSLPDASEKTPAMYAASAGSLPALEALLDRKTLDVPDTSGRTLLNHAIASGKLPVVEFLLSKGASLDAGKTPALAQAAEKGVWDVLQRVLEAARREERGASVDLFAAARSPSVEVLKLAFAAPGADANAKDPSSSYGKTLLMVAAGNPRGFEHVKFLLSRGADVHATTTDGETALYHASGGETARLLLSRGADPNAALRGSYQGRTALHDAATGSFEKVKALLDKGAKAVADQAGLTPAMLAAQASDPRIFRLLGAKSDANAADKSGKTLLMYASSGHPDGVDALLARGADPRRVSVSSETALHIAAGSWTHPARKVAALLAKGAEADAKDKEGRTPLLRAFERRERRTPRLLVAKGADPRHIDSAGRGILHSAAYADDEGMLRLAFELAPDADPNLRDKSGYVPLNRANSSVPAAVRVLLDHGAMPNPPDAKSNYLADIATYRPFSLVKLMLDRGADANAGCPLCAAAAGGRRRAVQALLERGAGINANRDGSGGTPLRRAAANGRAQTVRLLLEKGASDPGAALGDAAEGGHVGAIKALLEKGADPELADKDGNTPLMRAAKSGSLAAVRALLDAGAKVDSSPEKSPLFAAARGGSVPVFKLLERRGGGVKLVGRKRRTPLHGAAYDAKTEMVRYLLEAGADPVAVDEDGKTPLSEALTNSNLAPAELLLAKGASVDGFVKAEPLLHTQVGYYCDTRAKWLLDRGARVDAVDGEGRTALMKTSSPDCARLLLSRGAGINIQAQDGRTALIEAADSYSGNAPLVRLLLERGAYTFYSRKSDGRGPLSLAAGRGSEAAVEALLEKGATVDDSDGKGMTPLMFAVESGSTRTVRLLLEKGANVNRTNSSGKSPFMLAVGGWRSNPAMIRQLAQAGAQVDVRDENQRTPLSLACDSYSISTETVKLLLELGADPNVPDKWNTMPLGNVLYRENLIAAGMLADKGADLDASTYFGTPVLVWAAQNGKLAAVKFLTGRGAKLETPGSSGRTALMEAAYNGHLDVVRHLVEKGASLTAGDSGGHNALKWAEMGSKSAVQTYLAARTPSAAPVAAASAPAAPAQAAVPAQPGVSSSDLQNLVKAAVQGAMEASKPAPAAPKKTFSSDVDKPSYKAAERPQDAALVIGIERYAGDLPPAEHAERDAAAVRAHLAALGVPARNLIHLTGERAGRASIEKYVEQWLPNVAKPGSRVYVYFSGHGAPDVKKGDAYLVPWDGDPNYLETTAYPVSRLYAKLEKLPAAEVLVAMDACFSGAKGRSVLPKGARPLVTKVVQAAPTGKVVSLSASDSNEITGTYDEQGHGLFTYYLLKGLNGAAGGAGSVTSGSLYRYLKPKVQDEAQRSNRQQTPQYAGRGEVPLR